jgi:hypothetical protein
MGVVTFLQLGEISLYIAYFENTVTVCFTVFRIRQVREVHTLQQVQHSLSTEGSKHYSKFSIA